MPDILTTVPSTIPAGDSLSIVWTHPDYPRNGGWTATLVLAGASIVGPVTGGAYADDATAHEFTVADTETAAATPSSYTWAIRVASGTTTTTAAKGTVTITPDPFTLTDGEALSWEETTLSVVNAALTNTLTDGMKMYMINGRQVQSLSLDELYRLKNRLQTVVNATRGGGFGTPVRFDVVHR